MDNKEYKATTEKFTGQQHVLMVPDPKSPDYIETIVDNFDHIPDKLIHLTPESNLQSILDNGLKVSHKARTSKWNQGIYLASDINSLITLTARDSFKGKHVLLEVDVTSFKSHLKPDPEYHKYSGDNRHYSDDIAWYYDQDIPSRLVKVIDSRASNIMQKLHSTR